MFFSAALSQRAFRKTALAGPLSCARRYPTHADELVARQWTAFVRFATQHSATGLLNMS
jgi:hypothetical protein